MYVYIYTYVAFGEREDSKSSRSLCGPEAVSKILMSLKQRNKIKNY